MTSISASPQAISQTPRVAPSPMVRAVDYVRRMRGGAQAHLMRCSDGAPYVVKFPNNPQGPRILANELLAGRLAERLNLPVAAGRVVSIDPVSIGWSGELVMELSHGTTPCQAGLCFGSRYVVMDPCWPQYDLIPDESLKDVENIEDFCGILVFDLWTCNADKRQVVFFRNDRLQHRVAMIDQGHCFNGNSWSFPDSPLRSLYWQKSVYQTVKGVDAFDPWLNRLESEIDENVIYECADGIPSQWYESDTGSLDRLLDKLNHRRRRVRELLWSAETLASRPFPNWDRGICNRERKADGSASP